MEESKACKTGNIYIYIYKTGNGDRKFHKPHLKSNEPYFSIILST